jgi:hypothetical protein
MTGTNAACACFDRHDAAIFNCFDLLKIRVPYGTGFVIGMAHIVTEAGAFTADITFSRHIFSSQLVAEKRFIAD